MLLFTMKSFLSKNVIPLSYPLVIAHYGDTKSFTIAATSPLLSNCNRYVGTSAVIWAMRSRVLPHQFLSEKDLTAKAGSLPRACLGVNGVNLFDCAFSINRIALKGADSGDTRGTSP